MVSRLEALFQSKDTLSLGWAILVLFSLLAGVALEQYWMMAVPALLLGMHLLIDDYRRLFYLFFMALPFSIEVYLPNGLGTDLPTEQLMWLMTGLSLVLLISKIGKAQSLSIYWQPITFLVIAHLIWIGFTTLWSTDIVRSLKFLLAKLWYVIPFYFFAIHVLKSRNTFLRVVNILIWSLTASMIYVVVRHLGEGLTFASSNDVVQPIYRNHVNYAAIMVIVLPFVVMKGYLSKQKIVYACLVLFFLFEIYFSFTRAAILGIGIGIGAYLIIKYRMVVKVLVLSLFTAAVSIIYLTQDNNFLRLAPDFERTVVHKKFDNLIEATYKMEDISTMERLYRWVAGFEMLSDRPWMGFGPNTFYVNYDQYTITAFQTYVSDNPDKSGVHNYYLMTAVDQGIIGLLIFLALIAVTLIYGERVYHKLTDSVDKAIVMAVMTSFIILLSLNLINDLIETDKTGIFFFLTCAVVNVYFARLKGEDRLLDSRS